MPDIGSLAPTRDQEGSRTSQTPNQPSHTTQTIEADYFLGITLGDDQRLAYDGRQDACVTLVLGPGGIVHPDTLVIVQDSEQTRFHPTQGIEAFPMRANFESGTFMHASETGLSLVAWPQTGRLPGGSQESRQLPDDDDDDDDHEQDRDLLMNSLGDTTEEEDNGTSDGA